MQDAIALSSDRDGAHVALVLDALRELLGESTRPGRAPAIRPGIGP